MIPWRFFLVGLPLILLAPVHAEILVYKSSVNRWSSTLIQNGTKSTWVKALRGSKMDAYSLYYLDGTNLEAKDWLISYFVTTLRYTQTADVNED